MQAISESSAPHVSVSAQCLMAWHSPEGLPPCRLPGNCRHCPVALESQLPQLLQKTPTQTFKVRLHSLRQHLKLELLYLCMSKGMRKFHAEVAELFSAGLRDAFIQRAKEAHFHSAELKQLFYSELFPNFADTLLSGELSLSISNLQPVPTICDDLPCMVSW